MVPQVKNRPAPKRASVGVIVVLVAILLLPFTTASPARADTASVRQAVVHLKQTWTAQVYVPLTKPLTGTLTAVTSCSAAFISAQADILTAGHCVDPQQGYGQLQLVLFNELKKRYPGSTDAELVSVVRQSNITNQQLQVLAYQPDELGGVLNNSGIVAQVKQPVQTLGDGDHAFLKLNNFTKPTPFLGVAQARPVERDSVTVVGFPGAIQFSSDAARQNASFKQGVISSFQTFQGAAYTEVDAGMEPGMSGGPVLNANDEIIGVVSWGRTDAKTVNFATDTATMRSFLASHGVSLTAPSAPQPSGSEAPLPAPVEPAPASDQGIPTYVWVMLAVVVAGVAVLFVLMRGRNKASSQGQQPHEVRPSQVWQGPQQPPQGGAPQFGNQPQGWQPNGQQPNVPPPAQGWPPNNGTPPSQG